MADNGMELQRIAWTQAFPFVRLFRTFSLALNFNRLMLALLCVVVVYLGGRILDRPWLAADSGVLWTTEPIALSEIDVYVQGDYAQYHAWVGEAQEAWKSSAEARERLAVDLRSVEPRGPFISLLNFESRCFAAAVRGVATGNFGFAAPGEGYAMAGGIVDAWRGAFWFVTHRPWYALVYGLFHLIVFALFGGAICRSAAVQLARDESIGMGEALRFAREKYTGLLMAPLLPVGLFVFVTVVMALGGWVGGLLGQIPFVGGFLFGLPYVLAILGGLVMAATFLATALGFHLMWPTIAAEGSDGFDALSRAFSYIGSRIWHVAFYSFVLLVYGALSFVLVRLVVLLVLKFSHRAVAVGMNVFDSSAAGDGKLAMLDGMWTMPSWADLSLLPAVTEAPVYGTLFAAGAGNLALAERIGGWLIALWVFLVVAILGAYAISYFFCGSTQMYFLLRRDVDATDYDEIYYEQPEEVLSQPPAVTGAPDEPTPAGEPSPGAAPPSAGGAERPASAEVESPPPSEPDPGDEGDEENRS